jgi:hypothetical protein
MMLGVEAGSWDGLKRWVAEHWSEVVDAVKKRLEGVEAGPGFDLAGALVELEGLKSRLDDDKVARELMAPALLLMQAEKLGVDETTLRYFSAAASGAVDGDGYVSSKRREVDLTSGEREVALLWAAALAAHSIKTKVEKAGSAFLVVASSYDAVKLACLYFLYGPPLLEGDDRLKNHKLTGAVGLGAEGHRWYVRATTDKLAAGHEKLRKALAEIVREAAARGWIDAGRAERLLEKLEGGCMLKEGWPMYEVRLTDGALVVKFNSTNPDNIEREAQRLREMGLEEGLHFTVKMSEGGDAGCLYILKEGLAYAAWLSVHGFGRQKELAAEFIEYILQRAREEGDDVYKKVLEVVEEGKAEGF